MRRQWLTRLEDPRVAFFVALAFRLAFAFSRFHPLEAGDAMANAEAAHQVWRTGSLILTRPPVFPAFLSLVYVWPGDSTTLALIVQSILSALCVPLVRGIADEIGQRPAGVWAMWWVALDPFLIHFNSYLLTETLFITLFLGGLYAMFRAHARGSAAGGVAGGVLLALAALCRSIFLPLVPLILIAFAAGALWKGRQARRTSAIFTLGLVVPLIGWALYVRHETGVLRVAAPQRGWTMYEGLNPDFDHPDAILRWQKAMEVEARQQGIAREDGTRMEAYFWEKSKAWVRTHPMAYARLMVRKVFKFWRVIPYGDYYSRSQMAVSALFFTPLLLLALFGAWTQWRSRKTPTWGTLFVIGFILAYSVLNTVTWTQIRYRVPLHPLLAILAGMGLARLSGSPEAHA